MSLRRIPRCYHCNDKSARADSKFCTVRCAAAWGEQEAADSDDWWCPWCDEWHDQRASFTCPDDGKPANESDLDLGFKGPGR